MNDLLRKIRDFFSSTGSFSQRELVIACVILIAAFYLISALFKSYPDLLPPALHGWAMLGLYGLWGMAVGKRSRDLGTTFTYGVVVGVLFPVIGIVFLFQRGKKSLGTAAPPPSEPSGEGPS